jgi:hypothetical protein
MDLKRQMANIFVEYLNALSGLPCCGLGQLSVSALFPHLERKEVVAELLEGCGVVASPSIIMKNVVHLVSYDRNSDTLKLLRTLALSRTGSEDRADVKYARRAAKFAIMHWGGRLILPPVKAVVAINLIDPGSSGIGEKINGNRILYVALSRDFQWIMYNTNRARHNLVEQFLVHQTVCSIEGRELMTCGQRGETYNCELCGSPLEKYRCGNCGHSFAHCPCCQDSIGETCFKCQCEVLEAEHGFSLGPLGKKLVKYLEARGHIFAVDPDIARDREWKYTDDISARKLHDY